MRALLSFAAALISLPGPSTAQAQPGRTAPSIYATHCAECHGDAMQGGPAPALAGSGRAPLPGAAELARLVRHGMPGTGKAGFADALSDGDIHALVVYLREQAGRATSPMPERSSPPPAAPRRGLEHTFRIVSVVEDLDVPWALAFLPDGRMLFTERTGALFAVEREGKRWGRPRPIAGVPPVWARDEGGLLDVMPHPRFARNGWVYLTLSDPGPDDTGATKVVRARLRGDTLVDHDTVFAAPGRSYSAKGVNFGSRLVFDGDYLFISFGERGELGQAQDLALPNGKIHRVFHDGAVPPDNPFVGTPGALPTIWSLGHRNPQGLARNPVDGALWETEHGPRGGDELNLIRPGRNYGWPVITYGMNYDGTPVSALTEREGMEQPVIHWTPSIAVSAIHFYTGDAFPRWKHSLFIGSLAQQELHRLEVSGDRVVRKETVLAGLGRVRDVTTGPDGFLYVALELPGEPGRIVRLVPAAGP